VLKGVPVLRGRVRDRKFLADDLQDRHACSRHGTRLSPMSRLTCRVSTVTYVVNPGTLSSTGFPDLSSVVKNQAKNLSVLGFFCCSRLSRRRRTRRPSRSLRHGWQGRSRAPRSRCSSHKALPYSARHFTSREVARSAPTARLSSTFGSPLRLSCWGTASAPSAGTRCHARGLPSASLRHRPCQDHLLDESECCS